MAKPIITFYLRAYNAEQYIGQSIRSVLNQTLENIELILINNASTDNTGKICRHYANKDKRIIFLENEKNTLLNPDYEGKWVDPNGEYFSFIDADDFLDIEFAEKMYIAAKKDNLEMVVCGVDVNIQTGKEQRKERIPPKIDYKNIGLFRDKFEELYFFLRTNWGIIYRTDFFLVNNAFSIQNPEWLVSGRDTILVLRYMRRCNTFAFLDKALYNYRVHEGQYYNKSMTAYYAKECQYLYEEGIELLKHFNALSEKNVYFLQDVHLASITDFLESTIKNDFLKVEDRLNIIESIAVDSLFNSYGRNHKNNKVVLDTFRYAVKSITKGLSVIDVSKMGNYFISHIYRAVEERNNYSEKDFISLLLAGVCNPKNHYLWGMEYFGEAFFSMNHEGNDILRALDQEIGVILRYPRVLREIINKDYQNVFLEINAEKDLKKTREILIAYDSVPNVEIGWLQDSKSRLIDYVNKGRLSEAIDILMDIYEVRMLDRDVIYFKIYIGWQIGDKELVLNNVEVASVFWNEDGDLMAICGDVMAAIGAFSRALEFYNQGLLNAHYEELILDLRKRIKETEKISVEQTNTKFI